MALAPGGLLYVIARSQFTYGSLDKDFSMVIVFLKLIIQKATTKKLMSSFWMTLCVRKQKRYVLYFSSYVHTYVMSIMML